MTRRDVDLREYPRDHNHITEAELFQAHGIRPSADPETVRRRLIDGLEAETAPRADGQDTSSPARPRRRSATRP